MLSLAARWVPPSDVEDVVQETYVRICKVASKGEVDSPKSFLFRTVINLGKDLHKRSDRRLLQGVESLDELDPYADEPERNDILSEVISNEEFGFFCEAVRVLPSQCRRAFVLKKVYGYSQKEIAMEMGISENTVENYIATGMKKCARYMKAYQQDGTQTGVNASGNTGDLSARGKSKS